MYAIPLGLLLLSFADVEEPLPSQTAGQTTLPGAARKAPQSGADAPTALQSSVDAPTALQSSVDAPTALQSSVDAPTALQSLEAAKMRALGTARLAEGRLEQAEIDLLASLRLEPDHPIALRDLARLFLLQSRFKEAKDVLLRARNKNLVDPVHYVFEALSETEDEHLDSERGSIDSAQDVGRGLPVHSEQNRNHAGPNERLASLPMDSILLRAARGERDALHELQLRVELQETEDPDALWVLAAESWKQHDPGIAEDLLLRMDKVPASSGLPTDTGKWRERGLADLKKQIEETKIWATSGTLGSGIRFVQNPMWSSRSDTVIRDQFAAEWFVRAGAKLALRRWRWEGAGFYKQLQYLQGTERLQRVSTNGFGFSAKGSRPIGDLPSRVRFGITGFYNELFGDWFREHFVRTGGGGVDLSLALNAPFLLGLGVQGEIRDFLDPMFSQVGNSPLNRDVTEQRAFFSVTYQPSWFQAELKLLFLRDDAVGDAFDAVGGGASGQLTVHPFQSFEMRSGLSLLVRDFGPVGEQSILGAAATRTESRTTLFVEARYWLFDAVSLFLSEQMFRSSARAFHDYAQNQMSFGAEVHW